jgi:hypothetical protein
MSEVSMAFASEYVGRTFADITKLVTTSHKFDETIGKPFTDEGYDYFAKYMFEVCYNLLCLNTKLGVIHGDLHLNNATIGALYYTDLNYDHAGKKVVYVIDDNNQYVFPNNTYFSSIIDFSRSIINPNTYGVLVDESLPASMALVADEAKFKAAELNSLLTLYIQLFPNKLKQREELTVLFKHHFDIIFKVLTSIDIYMFSIRMAKLLTGTTYKVGKKIIALVNKMNKIAESYITTTMNELIEDEKMAKKVEEEDYPMLAIIKKCFPEYIDGMKYNEIGTITDIYCYQNEMKDSIVKYSRFPEVLKFVKYEDKDGKVEEQQIFTEKRKQNREEYEKTKTKNLEMIKYIAMRHKQKLT